MSDSTWTRRQGETPTEYRLRYLVRHEMRVARVSQVEMAARVGCSRAHMCEMLVGRSPLTVRWAEDILRTLGKQLTLEVVPGELRVSERA